MSYKIRKTAFITSAMGALLLLGSLAVSAQNVDQQYRQWQRAQMEAQQRQQDYMRTRSSRDYQQWQRAQVRAQREYNDYQQAQRRYGSYTTYNTYNNDPYYTGVGTSGGYRVYNNGSYYETNARGAAMLRQAVQYGYQQGYRQGQVDRRYNRGYNYGNANMYRSGTYGWSSHVARDQYQYYFQQGFQKGYEDGYNSTYRYGTRSGNGFNILSGVLNTILNIANP